MLLASWLRNVLRATAACNFSSHSQPPDGSAPAALAIRDFSTFSRTCIFFLLTLSLLWSSCFFPFLLWLFPPLLFHLSILSEVGLLNFLRFLNLVNFDYVSYISDATLYPESCWWIPPILVRFHPLKPVWRDATNNPFLPMVGLGRWRSESSSLGPFSEKPCLECHVQTYPNVRFQYVIPVLGDGH